MKRRNLAVELRVARAKLAAYRNAVGTEVVSVRALGQPAKFIQCWSVSRGYSAITQALDEDGQVWERVSLMESVREDGVTRKVVKESWWEPVDMTRKTRPAEYNLKATVTEIPFLAPEETR